MRGFAPSLARAVLPAALVLASAIGSIALAAGSAAVPSRDAALLAPQLPPALRDTDPALPTLTSPDAAPPRRPAADNGRVGDDTTFCNVFLNESERERSGATGFC